MMIIFSKKKRRRIVQLGTLPAESFIWSICIAIRVKETLLSSYSIRPKLLVVLAFLDAYTYKS